MKIFFFSIMLSMPQIKASFAGNITTINNEFYKIQAPIRKSLNQNYQYDIDVDEENVKKDLDLEKVRNVYVEKENNINKEEKKVEQELKEDKKEEKAKSKRQKFKEDKGESDTQISKKEQKKTWLDSWFPDTGQKPFEMVGAYTSIKLLIADTMNTNVSAKETTALHDTSTTKDLFSGTAKFRMMPAIMVAVGNDRFKYFRWEFELGYIPLLLKSASLKVSDDYAGYTFYMSKKDLSIHLMTLCYNNYLQYAFFDKKLVGFLGIGIGVGYGFSMGNTLSSDFAMPIVKAQLGVSFLVGRKSKVNIAYTMMYTKMDMPNKYSFDRTDQAGRDWSNRAIQKGSLKFQTIITNAISLEYQFYTA